MKTWIFDFDGTLTDVDLGKKFSDWVFSTDQVGIAAKLIRLIGAPINIVLRRANRGQKILSWSFGLSPGERDRLFELFLDEYDRNINLNKEVFSLIENAQSSVKVLLTGCHEELAKKFLTRRGIDCFEEIIGLRMQNSFVIKSHPYARTKVRLADVFSPYIAAGDSWPDRYFLKNATAAYVVSRDQKLIDLAKKSGWTLL